MEPFEKESNTMSVTGVILLLLTLGSVYFAQSTLKVSRPVETKPVEQTLEGEERTRARLWEDPFEAVYREIKDNQNKPLHFTGQITLQKRSENWEILGVMVPSGPYFESMEMRRRYRYAVLSALNVTDYVPHKSEFIGYLMPYKNRALSNTSSSDGCWADYNQANNRQLKIPKAIPYEWFAKANTENEKRLLLLWLPEESFQLKPFIKLNSIFYKAFKGTKNASFTLLGPFSSGVLKVMTEELSKLSEKEGSDKKIHKLKDFKKFNVFSPSATIDNDQLYIDENDTADISLDLLFQGIFGKESRFIRTINSNCVLVNLLLDELGRRMKKVSDIVLITQSDTQYSRSLLESFKREYEYRVNNDKENRKKAEDKGIYDVSYMRGIDGITVSGVSEYYTKKVKQQIEKDSDKKSNYGFRTIRPPIGNGQFDYLRRLADKIHMIKGDTKAIGILGNDVYDKLLILQVLKNKFPKAIFFTTDLDARLTHPDVYRWTRNLLVASNFGLDLHNDLQHYVPPFRDNYQTSIFLATIFATDTEKYNDRIEEINKNISNIIKGRIFEIGRNGAYPLKIGNNSNEKNEYNIHPEHSGYEIERTNIWISVLSTISGIFIIIILYPIRRNLRPADKKEKGIIWLFVIPGILIYAIIFYANNSNNLGEPLSFTDGISLWPTVIIRIIAITFTMYFLKRIYIDTRDNVFNTDKEFFLDGDPENPDTHTGLKEFNKWFWLPIILFFVVIFTPNLFKGNYVINEPIYLLGVSVVLFFIILIKESPVLRYITVHKWRLPNKGNGNKYFIEDIWSAYCQRSFTANISLRVGLMLLVYYIFTATMFALFGSPNIPYRGDVSLWIERFVLALNVALFNLMLFFVIDVLRRSTRMVNLIGYNDSVWRDSSIIKLKAETELKNTLLDNNSLNKWFKIKLIAEHTELLNHQIKYPVIIVVLMILARSNYFDNFYTPLSLQVVILASLLFPVIFTFHLSNSANRIKENILYALNNELPGIDYNNDSQNGLTEQKQSLIKNIKELKKGIFLPTMQQPVIKALFLLVSGLGVYLSEYFIFLY